MFSTPWQDARYFYVLLIKEAVDPMTASIIVGGAQSPSETFDRHFESVAMRTCDSNWYIMRKYDLTGSRTGWRASKAGRLERRFSRRHGSGSRGSRSAERNHRSYDYRCRRNHYSFEERKNWLPILAPQQCLLHGLNGATRLDEIIHRVLHRQGPR
ncbi:BQ5605_C001g00204 [Microbotryum silenes-dioicae]|uniref:BQ5605_C001g00204 protein n=1 Tax=Microbotryum silenes-dioicae TaxID=796604 RepID=A0A2X0MX27_9BASI|nr:BQ5605_C001g00204 [Microbotryum silenes-dioicae]